MVSAPDHDEGQELLGHIRPVLGGRLAWVAAADAYTRFGIAAATLATFTVVQLMVYAAMQVPVGVLIDRYGSKRLIITGSLVMAGCSRCRSRCRWRSRRG